MRGIKCNDERKWFVTFGVKFIEAYGIESLTVWSLSEESAIGYLEKQFYLEIVFKEEYESGNFDSIFEDVIEVE